MCFLLKCSLLLAVVAALPVGFPRIAVAQEAVETSSSAAGVSQVHPSEGTPEPSHKPQGSNTLAYWFGSEYHTPFVLQPSTFKAADIQRNALDFTHLDFWKLGSNFADVMVSQSDMTEPAASGGTGATEIYAILRSDVGLNQVMHSSTFQVGPLRDLAVEAGANLETKNSSFAPAERTLYVGPKLQFALPRGFFNVGVHFRKEWNHEGVLGKAEHYNPNFNTELNWMLPITLGKLHMAYAGFAEYNTPKGKDSFGTDTVSEYLIRSIVSTDAGQFLFRRAKMLDVSAGLWYWHNEYGKPSAIPGAEQVAPFVGLVYHLDGGRGLGKR